MQIDGEKMGAAVVATMIAEPALAMMHAGVPGIAFGLFCGGLAYSFADDIRMLVGKKGEGHNVPPQPHVEDQGPSKSDMAHSWAYRLLHGKSERGDSMPFQGTDEDALRADHKHCLFLGEDLWPHANSILSNRIAILGMPGAGKSNGVAVLSEELARYDAPLIIFDSKPEYGPLCDKPYFSNPFRANASNVTPENAQEFGMQLMQHRAQVVLDLRSYGNDTKAAAVMIGILAGIWAWEAQRPNDERIPCTVALEEAHLWLPQRENMSTVSRYQMKDGTSVFSRLQQAFFRLNTGGRSLGLGLIISTQRPADVDKRLLAIAEWKFLLKADMPNDLEVYKSLGADPAVIQSLKNGEAFVRGPDVKGVYQLRRRNSPDEARTPGLDALQRASVIYKNDEQENAETPIYRPVNDPVNGSTSDTGLSSAKPHLQLLVNGKNGDTEPLQMGDPAVSVNVSDEVKDIINRLYAQGIKHNQIAKAVRLDGRKYDTYRQTCSELGIAVEREAL